MDDLLVLLLMIFSGLLVAGVYFWFFDPKEIYKLYVKLRTFLAGLKVKTCSVGDFTWTYAERGKSDPNRPSLLFVHGFSSNKDNWASVVRWV